MSKDPLAPIGQAFDQGMDEVAGIFVTVFLIVFVLLIISTAQIIDQWWEERQKASLSPWEEPADGSGLWWGDDSLHLGEEIEWS